MPLKNKRFVIPFDEGRAAFAVQVPRRFDPVAVGRALGFDRPRPTIYVTGGASAMSPEDMATTRNIVEKGLVRFAEEQNVDLIVINSHKIEWDEPTQGLGTISYKVSILADCPVLLVK